MWTLLNTVINKVIIAYLIQMMSANGESGIRNTIIITASDGGRPTGNIEGELRTAQTADRKQGICAAAWTCVCRRSACKMLGRVSEAWRHGNAAGLTVATSEERLVAEVDLAGHAFDYALPCISPGTRARSKAANHSVINLLLEFRIFRGRPHGLEQVHRGSRTLNFFAGAVKFVFDGPNLFVPPPNCLFSFTRLVPQLHESGGVAQAITTNFGVAITFTLQAKMDVVVVAFEPLDTGNIVGLRIEPLLILILMVRLSKSTHMSII